jgi:HAD superfamily hydrolase (TIGR01509 family)
MTTQRSVAVFDLGGVLIDWNPRHLYRKLFDGDDAAMEHFLANICTQAWNHEQDAGRTFAEGCALLKAMHPHEAQRIDAWFERYDEMLAGPIQGTVDILAELRGQGVPIYALSNWSSETFPFAAKRFEFLKWFNGIMLSGEVGLVKPDAEFFEHFFKTFAVDPASAVFVDDLEPNIKGAAAVGMHGIRFTNPTALRAELRKMQFTQG